MVINYLKRCSGTVAEDQPQVHAIAARIISDVAQRGELAAEHYAREVDGLIGPVDIPARDPAELAGQIPRSIQLRIQRLHDSARRFAEQQQRSVEFDEVELAPGHLVGQHHLPLRSVGLLIDASRFNEIGAAVAAVTCAKAVGVPHVAACMSSNSRSASAAAMHYALCVAGVDRTLALGGVQAMASLAYGLFNVPAVELVVGGDTRYMHAARSILFPEACNRTRAGAGRFALVASGSASVRAVTDSLLSGLSDSRNDRVRLLTDNKGLAEAVMDRVRRSFADVPNAPPVSAVNRALRVLWQHRVEILIVNDALALVQAANDFAPRRLQVLSKSHDWWLERLCAYGSLIFGEEPPALFGDAGGETGDSSKLVRSGAATRGFYPDGISGYDFMRLATWQRSGRAAVAGSADNNQEQGTVIPFRRHAQRTSSGAEGTIGAAS